MRSDNDNGPNIAPRPLQPGYHSFLLRLWLERNGNWRGEMVHFQSDHRHLDQPADGLIETLQSIITPENNEVPAGSSEDKTNSP